MSKRYKVVKFRSGWNVMDNQEASYLFAAPVSKNKAEQLTNTLNSAEYLSGPYIKP